MSSYLLSSAYLFPKGAPTKHTDQAWFRRPEDSQSNLDLLEREEALYATAIYAIRNVAAPKPIGFNTGNKKSEGLVDVANSGMRDYPPRRFDADHQDASDDNNTNMDVVEDHSFRTGIAVSPRAGIADSTSTPRRERGRTVEGALNSSGSRSTSDSSVSMPTSVTNRRHLNYSYDESIEIYEVAQGGEEDDMDFDESYEQQYII
mmetsp:Transcript_105/g.184  ORF Transcript_105/g.184 Transcript_105/m.184 type:complete len:204 (+) Transcript_105:56-667(+)